MKRVRPDFHFRGPPQSDGLHLDTAFPVSWPFEHSFPQVWDTHPIIAITLRYPP